MGKIIRKRIIIRPGSLSNLSSKTGNDMETAGGRSSILCARVRAFLKH